MLCGRNAVQLSHTGVQPFARRSRAATRRRRRSPPQRLPPSISRRRARDHGFPRRSRDRRRHQRRGRGAHPLRQIHRPLTRALLGAASFRRPLPRVAPIARLSHVPQAQEASVARVPPRVCHCVVTVARVPLLGSHGASPSADKQCILVSIPYHSRERASLVAATAPHDHPAACRTHKPPPLLRSNSFFPLLPSSSLFFPLLPSPSSCLCAFVPLWFHFHLRGSLTPSPPPSEARLRAFRRESGSSGRRSRRSHAANHPPFPFLLEPIRKPSPLTPLAGRGAGGEGVSDKLEIPQTRRAGRGSRPRRRARRRAAEETVHVGQVSLGVQWQRGARSATRGLRAPRLVEIGRRALHLVQIQRVGNPHQLRVARLRQADRAQSHVENLPVSLVVQGKHGRGNVVGRDGVDARRGKVGRSQHRDFGRTRRSPVPPRCRGSRRSNRGPRSFFTRGSSPGAAL